MKRFASINPIYEKFSSITHPFIFSINPMIVADSRSHTIYFKSQSTSLKIEPKIIINTCYASQHGAVMLLTEDGRLRVYTQNFDEIARLPWQSKYSVGLQFLRNDSLLMIGATEVELLYVKVHSNIKSTKFVSSMSFNLEKKQKYIVEPQTKLHWNKGFNYSQQDKILYLWSSKDINFYSLKKLNLIAHLPSLTRKESSITYVLYNTTHKYTITGLINGIIKVWRLPVNIKEYSNSSNPSVYSAKDYILIHNYLKHTKQIDKIIQANFNSKNQNSKILISSSLQLSVCFWSLETFQLLRFYDFQSQYSALYLHNSLFSLCVRDKVLGMLQWGKNLEFIIDVTSEIIAFDKFQKQFSLKKDNDVASVQITLGSNIGFQIRDELLDAKDLNKIQIQYIYPPLKAKGIQQIISSPYCQNQYYLLVQNGEIYRLRIEQNSGKIQQSYQIEKAKDIEFHQLNQLPAIIAFLPILPPQFDSEINENSIDKKSPQIQADELENEEMRREKVLGLKLIAIGCTKGSIVFFKLDNFQNIYTRITYHRQPIKLLQSFTSDNQDYIASFCAENFLKIIKFDNVHEKAQCIVSVYAGNYISKLLGFEGRLAIILKKGFFQVYEISKIDDSQKSIIKKGLVNSQYELVCRKNLECQDHQSEIYSIDYDNKKKLLLTAGADNKIKIWTHYKVLLYEVFLDEGLKHALWFRNFQMLISHNLKILYFRNIGLKLSDNEIQEINNQFLQNQNPFETINDSLKVIKDLYEQDYASEQILNLSESKVKRNIFQDNKSSPKKSLVSSPTQTRGKLNKSAIHSNEIQLDLNKKKSTNFVRQKSVKIKESMIKHSSESTRRKKQNTKQQKSQTLIQQHQFKSSSAIDSDLQAMRKHLQQMKNLKQQANQSILPKIGPKNEDIFDNFMRSKLLNKKILTRRDITLNRIIMKNIIKDHFGNDSDVVNSLKLDF